MPIIDAFVERKQEEVMEDTWGQNRPQPGRRYPGELVFCLGEFGDITVIRQDFGDFAGGPWLAQDAYDFVEDSIKEDTPNGTIWRWKGWYQRFKNGRCRFVGKTELVNI